MSSSFLSNSVIGLLLLAFGLAFLAAVGVSRSQDKINRALADRRDDDGEAAEQLQSDIKWNRVAAIAAAVAVGLSFLATGWDKLVDFREKASLANQISSLRGQIRTIPDHYRLLTLTPEEQAKILANLRAAKISPMKAPAVLAECGSDETRVAQELADTFRAVPLPAFYAEGICSPDPFNGKKGIYAYTLDGTQDDPTVRAIILSVVNAGVAVTVQRATKAQLGPMSFPVIFSVDGD